MRTYINGAIKEAIGKGRALMSKIPGARELGVYFPSLAAIANLEIGKLIDEFDYLYNDTDYNDPRNIRQKFSKFKQLAARMADIENIVIAAMSRMDKDDEFVNKLVSGISQEINYPLPTPVASCLSQKYYHIYPEFNLVCIPLLESDFLLHIPDLYHELGHPLLSLDNPKVEAFQNNLGMFNVEVRRHFDEEIKRRELSRTKDVDFDPIFVWKESWLENWSNELFCDLFATFTLGPAYAWSNLHMCTKMSWEVYRIPAFARSTHPPDDARMTCIGYALEQLGFKEDARQIRAKWEQFKEIIDQKKPADFSNAVPDKLLRSAVEFCLVGTKQIGCDIAAPTPTGKVNSLLNAAWAQFWRDPEGFYEWERQAVADLKKSI